MRLYDGCIAGWDALLQDCPSRLLCPQGGDPWPDGGTNQLLFQSDTALELGGGGLPAVSGIAFTADQVRLPADRLLLYGPDLPQLRADSPYARLTLIRLREDALEQGDGLYGILRKIEYTRYHLNPKGLMLRISPSTAREMARVGKSAVAEGLDFEKLGQSFIRAYRRHPAVAAVELRFVTLPEAPYDGLSAWAEQGENITKTLDHLLRRVKMDCTACKLQELCAQVEQLCGEDLGR